ncbi:hypothetical protein [Litchfieldella rifensis]|uniref:Uncharacterized protein n=1 Tax=Litchfieldella rifensis TaxID=762643 RepID=A0ABV7LPN5_9GAMM
MTEEESEERTCNLSVMLSGYGGIQTWYDAKVGLRRQMTLLGRINDPHRAPFGDIDGHFPDSAFHNQTARLNIYSPVDPAWLDEIRTSLGDSDACGCVAVRAGVEPDRFEIEGEVVEAAPVTVRLDMSADAFEAIQRQAADANDHNRIMWAKVALSGVAVPETDSHFTFLKDLDVSTAEEYAVTGFEIFDTRYFDHMRGRVLQVEQNRDEGYGAYISVLLTEARYEMHTERALIHAISCEGRVINSRGKPYDGANVSIEFREFEPNQLEGLSKRAFFGRFGYWPKQPSEVHSSHQFTFNLHYVPDDARDLLVPILCQQHSTQVVLTINLTKEEKDLLAVTDKMWGDIRHYSFEVRQDILNKA